MPTTVQFRRGTDAQNDAFTGSAGEITYDTTNETLRAHDGSTAGGSILATQSYVTTQLGGISSDAISNGTSTLTVIASGGNIRANVGGSTVGLFTSSGVDITGTVTGTIFSGSGASLTNINGANIASGTIADARISSSSVTQHQANIDIATSQVTSGTFADARISSSSVTQHQSNITAVGTLASLTTSGDTTIGGNLTVNGTTTTINSTTLTVDDKLVVIASGAADAAAANGAGISVDGASATITYANTGDKWVVNKDFDLSSNDILNAGTINGTSTSAQYADLAENYVADTDYKPGTVLVVGGDAEVTACSQYADSASAGVVSTNPAHLMNSGLDTPNTVALALAGRVPCKVVGTVTKGDLLTTSEKPGVATRLLPHTFVPGCVIGKALENYDSNEIGIIEVLVGKS